MRKYLSKLDIREAKRATEIFNSMLKRGEIEDSDKIVRLHHIKCGCGVDGCIFISAERK